MKSTDDLQLNNINKRRESKTIYKDKENSKKKKKKRDNNNTKT